MAFTGKNSHGHREISNTVGQIFGIPRKDNPNEQIEALQAELNNMKRLYNKYARHKEDCNLLRLRTGRYWDGRKVGCTCGFEQAKKGTKAKGVS